MVTFGLKSRWNVTLKPLISSNISCSDRVRYRPLAAAMSRGRNEPRSPLATGKIGDPASANDRVGTLMPLRSKRAYEIPA